MSDLISRQAAIEEVMNYPETDEPKKIKEGGKDHD